MDCIKCESDNTLVDDFTITGIGEDGELQVMDVDYKCLECGYAWTR